MLAKESLSAPGIEIVDDSVAPLTSDSFRDNHHFLLADSTYFCKEWTSLFYADDMKLDVSCDHAFTITLGLKYPRFVDLEDDLNIARVFLGIKDQQKEYQECIEMGIYMGRIYVKDLFDTIKIDKENLTVGVTLVLNVCPNKYDKKCRTKLMVLDFSGSEIASIKTSRFFTADWTGGISTGAHFKSLRIEGVQSQR